VKVRLSRNLIYGVTAALLIGTAVTVTLLIRRQNTATVPMVIGMSAPQAEVALVAAGLTHPDTFAGSQMHGMVVSQTPAVGSVVPAKTEVRLTLGSLTVS
jgi:beta-lactam-binding protein with PASTA domain